MASKTVHQAEKKALDGANESQDTLLVAHGLMMSYGVGLRSSSPATVEMMHLPSPKRSRPASERAIQNNSALSERSLKVKDTRGTRVLDNSQPSQHSSIPETQDIGVQEVERPAEVSVEWDVAHDHGAVGDLNLPDTLPASAEIDSTSRRKKMDSTQASTQSNTGRSYDQYRRSPSPGRTSPPRPAKCSSPERGTLDDGEDDDTGVRFDFANVADTDRTVSPAQDDSGFVDFGNVARFRHVASQQTAQSPTQHMPETPAPPQNPFRHSRSQLLPTSQLFRGTQFSSPVKLASPTSSRPSPAVFPGNSISPNPIISSPLKTRGLRSSSAVAITSSPEVLPGTTSPSLDDTASSPVNTASTENPIVPESSHDGPTRKKSGPEPMSTYEPMRKSQERRETSKVESDPVSSGEDDDQYDLIARRRRARSKKEAGLKQLDAINLHRPPKPEDVEVPSTRQRKRTSQAEAHTAQRSGQKPAADDPEGPDAISGTSEQRSPPIQDRPVEDDESTQSDVEEQTAPTVDPTPSALPKLPRSSTRSASQLARGSGTEAVSNGDAIPETSPTTARPEPFPEVVPSVEPVPSGAKSTSNFQSSPPAFSTRARKAKGYPRAPSTSSSLSNLASTPQLPSSNPPGTTTTAPPGSPTESTIVASSSPIVAQTKRRDTRGRLPKLKTGSTESLRQSTRVTRRGSSSTDELSRSISGTPTFEQSLRVSRLSVSRSASRSGRGAMKPPPTQRDPKLFENMAFAISFQSRKPGESSDQYSARVDFSAMVQKRIKQAGGRVLENGFDELFEALSMGTPSSSPGPSPAAAEAEISLTTDGQATGFTALIADGHSRKVKYMQALALGLPCVAARWVTTCLDRNEIVDWTPYMLCAGQSAFLGDAIRSRSLAPYEASTARLADVIAQRAKLLEGSRILAVVKKALEGKKMAYVFLARVLGASLTRVYGVDEAKAEMKAAEEAGQPFDWVYVDGKEDEEALFATTATTKQKQKQTGGGKKRKRAATASSVQPPAKRVRTLSDELVIQSLILGRLIEDGELEG